MKPIVLRDYQQGPIDRARYLVNHHGKKRLLIVAPCGAGKGHIIAKLLASTVERGHRALAIAHRKELIEDLADRVCRFGFMPGVIMANRDQHLERPVQVASIQTLSRRDKPVADLVIIDEAHHSTASSYLQVLDHYPNAVVVGLTATPCRLGGQPLGDVFEDLIEPIRSSELVERGLLVPVRGFAYDAPDLRHVKKKAGDFSNDELAALVDTPKVRGNIVEQYLLRARGTRAIVFAVNVDHSQKLAADFCAHGVRALHVDGETPRDVRKAAFEAFRSGAAQVLTNCSLFTEGVDLPAIETVILGRPTMSTSLGLQMIGRGRRPLPCPCGEIPHWRNATCTCGLPVPKRFVRLHDHAGICFSIGMPDDPREWSLTETFDTGAPKLTSAKPGSAIRTCKACFCVYLADELACPNCGASNRAPKKLVRNAKGIAVALEDVERAQAAEEPTKASAEVQKKFFLFLVGLEKSRGYRRGYAEMRFHGKFKCWPPAKLWRAQFGKAPVEEFVPAGGIDGSEVKT